MHEEAAMANGMSQGAIRPERVGRRTVVRATSALIGGAALLGNQDAQASTWLGEQLEPNARRSTTVAYEIEGRLLEVCTCNILCPCWVGEDPDGGTCDSSFAWQIDNGTIEGVDVSGRTIALSVHIPGNVLAGNWRAVVYVDDRATDEQKRRCSRSSRASSAAPIADLAGLIGEVITVERAPITFTVDEGEGTLTIGEVVDAELAPFQGATGDATALHDTVFTTIPGSPAFVGKAAHYRRDGPEHGLADIDLKDNNAIQGLFRFEA